MMRWLVGVPVALCFGWCGAVCLCQDAGTGSLAAP